MLRRGGVSRSGPKPIPSHLKVMMGNPGHQRLSEREPEAEPVTDNELPPPDYLQPYAAEEWRRAVPILRNMRVLTYADLKVLECYCCAYGRWRECEEVLAVLRATDDLSKGLLSPIVALARKERADTLRFAAEFGFSPSSRVRLATSPVATKSKFGDLI